MRTYGSNTYFETQSEALDYAFSSVLPKYEVKLPDHLWTEHVAYGQNVFYHLPLIVKSTGNPAKKCLHIFLYRMDSGRYELTYHKS